MDLKFWIEIFIILILVFVSGFFSASEIAIIAVRRSRMKKLAESGDSRAEFVERLKSNPDDFFAIVQIGMTVTASAASALGGATAILVVKPLVESIPIAAVHRYAESISIIAVIMAISYVFLVLAELVPKALAIRKSEKIALMVGPATWWSLKTVNILIRFLSWSTNMCLKLIRVSTDIDKDSTISEEEVKIILAEGLKHGVFEPEEQKLIHSIFEFTDSIARNDMTPRTEIVAVSIDETPERILKIATTEGYSRLPVYDETLDQIKGILYVRDILNIFLTDGVIILKDIMRPAMFVPDSRKISEVLKDMKTAKQHMAIVLDDFGGTAGIITLEDILEEIVGEIQDEYDKEDTDIVMQPDGSAIVKAYVDADLICEKFGVKAPEGEFESITGMVIDHLDHIPQTGESFEIAGLKITIIDTDGQKITRMKVEKLSK